MRLRILHSLVAGAVVAACTHSQQIPTEVSAGRPSAQKLRMAQVEFGSQAKFVACPDESCPSRTPKTLALAEPIRPVALPAPEPVPVRESPRQALPEPLPRQRTMTTQEMSLEFPFGGADLTPSARAKLRSAIGRVEKAKRIVIKGRTDSVGAEPANDRIALARAVTVRNFIRQLAPAAGGVIVVESKGSCCYVADNDSPVARARNRRVELVFEYES